MDGKSLALIGVAAVVGGVVGGVTVRLSSSPQKTTAKAESRSSDDSEDVPASDAGLEQRVVQLERSVAGLERRRRAAEELAKYGRALAAGDPAADGGAPIAVDDPVFDTAVRDVLDRVDQERRDERQQRRTERINRMVDDWASRMKTELSLSDQQQQKVAEIMREHIAKIQALRSGGDGGARPSSRQEWRNSLNALREENDKQLGSVLDSAQMDKMKKMREDGELPMFGGGFGRGRGRGPGGGN